MKHLILFALYGGPGQIMPITSGLAAIFAFLLIFWNKVLVAAGKLINLFRGSSSASQTPGNESLGITVQKPPEPSDQETRKVA